MRGYLKGWGVLREWITESCCDKFIMPERKVWNEEEDKILRLLREERGERKWANIARLMETEFGIAGRNGKQCRQRYHNHLDTAINNAEWSKQEQVLLLRLHEQIGNKWAVIAHKLQGRSDNHVKNHFYSKLRRAVRRLNKIISQEFAGQHKFIKESVLSKIIKTTESKFKLSSKIDEEVADFCNDVKNRLYRFELEEELGEDAGFVKKIIEDVESFDRDWKKGYKGVRNQEVEEYKAYLQPPPRALRKASSTLSCSSMKSDDSSSSFLSSSSCFSSSNLSDFQPESFMKPPNQKSLRKTSGNNSSDMCNSDLTQKQKHQDLLPKLELEHEPRRLPFFLQHQLLLDNSQLYERNNMRDMEYDMEMISDECPQIGSILAPREFYHAPFYLFEREPEDQAIQFKEQNEKMELQ